MTGLDRPLGFQEIEAVRISRQSAREGGKAVSPRRLTPSPSQHPGDIRGNDFCLRLIILQHNNSKLPCFSKCRLL